MIIYIDSDYRCHSTDSGGLIQIETDAFDGKCQAWIEGYRFVPSGQTWTREDGIVFNGEMIAPWKNYMLLDAAQREYERQQIEEMRTEIAELAEYAAEVEYQNALNDLGLEV